MLRAVKRRSLIRGLLTALLVIGCGDTPSEATMTDIAVAAEAPAPKTTEKRTPPRREGQPLPEIQGTTLDGRVIKLSSHLGKRTLIFLFKPEAMKARIAMKAVTAIEPMTVDYNFEILGVATGATRAQTQSFLDENAPSFPTVFDESGEIATRYGLQSDAVLIGMDSEGYFSFVNGVAPTGTPNRETVVEEQLRKDLLLPPKQIAALPELGDYPTAPDFTATQLDGQTSFSLAKYRGKPVILIFFLYNCPHCHHALSFFKDALPKLPKNKRPVFVGVEISGRVSAATEQLKTDGLDFFPALVDFDHSIRNAYGSYASVPDIFFIDPAGKIVEHTMGWRDQRDPPLMTMRLAKLAGTRIPMLLNKAGYSGSEFCIVCHDEEAQTWTLTDHSSAFNSLVKHGEDHNPECVGCHVVGYEKPGGFLLNAATPYMENVGCESCHGEGGGHLSQNDAPTDDYEPTCKICHNQKHSLGFDYTTFLPKVSHEANAELLALPLDKKQELLAKRNQVKAPLLPISADFVGSESCRECHEEEFKTWSKGPHAQAGHSLEHKGHGADTECLACHTTGFGRPGGFPKAGTIQSASGLAEVGCESCHGPGGNHIGEDAPRIGTIVSLGDKCNSCVILQICGACHDAKNDAGFEFKVQEKIDQIRHGTTKPGEIVSNRGDIGGNRSEPVASEPTPTPSK